MKLRQIGLVITLAGMASFAFSMEPTSIAGLLTGSQPLDSTSSSKPPTNIKLMVQPRRAVRVPATFDIALQEFEFCVDAQRDAPTLFLSASELDDGGLVGNCNIDETRRFKIRNQQQGKIVTLLLFPE